jgi:hypothetical protein
MLFLQRSEIRPEGQRWLRTIAGRRIPLRKTRPAFCG